MLLHNIILLLRKTSFKKVRVEKSYEDILIVLT